VAMEMLLTGRRMTAAEGSQWGLVNRLVPSSELLTEAMRLAHGIRASAPLAVAAVKEINESTAMLGVDEAFRRLREKDLPSYQAMLSSEDAKEGPQAFVEKRAPRWQGH
jgi:crotonobetainyl-CoA hydratase